LVGETFPNVRGDLFKVTEFVGMFGDQRKYRVRFDKTGYEKIVFKSAIRSGQIKDQFVPVVFGTGYLGYGSRQGNEKAYQVWQNMLSRCYNPKTKDYISYGAIGVKVCDRWHCFEKFLEDLPLIDGYSEDLFLSSEITLDKDIKHQYRVYSKDTCCFVSLEENMKNRNTIKYRRRFVATDPSGTEYKVEGIVQFAKDHGLDAKTIDQCLAGKYKQHKGWIFRELDCKV
jgi:hypothetical protein